MKVQIIANIEKFEGVIPPKSDLIVFEKGDPEDALVLYDFSEVGLYDHYFKKAAYGFSSHVA